MNLPLELVARVPDDPRLARAAQMRQPVVEAFSDAPSAVAYRDAAAALMRDSERSEDGFAEFAYRLLDSARILGLTN